MYENAINILRRSVQQVNVFSLTTYLNTICRFELKKNYSNHQKFKN